jgi:outer membrane protein OmpA-like peptidoglycan-associated protein
VTGGGLGQSGPSGASGATAGGPGPDFDQDGNPDPTCGTADLGGGLVVRTLCTPLPPDLESGVVATEPSVLSTTGVSFEETANVDVGIHQAQTESGQLATIFILGSDTLFDSGASAIKPSAEVALAGVVSALNAHFPEGSIIVRGHADSTGDPGQNQVLSAQRAGAVAEWLVGHDLQGPRPQEAGLGSAVPAAREDTEIGKVVNRRVEIVVLT